MFVPNIALELREKIQAVFYDGRIVPQHTETEHFYKDTVTGKVHQSVTTKTSLLSRDYYKQMAADKAVDHIQEHAHKFGDMEPAQISEVFSYAREAHAHDLKRAGSWGTHGHDLVDRYVQEWMKTGVRPDDIKAFVTSDISPEGVCAGLSAMKFFDDYTLYPIASELRVCSPKHDYAGTLDSLWLIGEVYTPKGKMPRRGTDECVGTKHNWFNKGRDRIKCGACGREEQLKILLGDWKTSNMIFGVGKMSKFDYAMQVMAYSSALKELAGIKCHHHWIIRLDKKTPHYEIGVITNPKEALRAFMSIITVSNFARSPVPPIEPLNKKQVITL